MKRMMSLALFALAAALWACDDDGTGVEGPDALVGTWISAGAAVAPALREEADRDSVWVAFTDDGTLTYIEYTGDLDYDRSGIYEVGEADGPIYPITFLAEPPATDTMARGIFRVDGDRLQLEVVFRWRPLIPATVERGFGSTLDEGVELGPYWIQVFERRE